MPDNFFIGNKETSIFLVDLDKGQIINKISQGIEDPLFSKPVSGENLISIIRTDSTLRNIVNESHKELWNITHSEITVIQIRM